MKTLNGKFLLPRIKYMFPRNVRENISSYITVSFIVCAMVLFFFLSKKATVDTKELIQKPQGVLAVTTGSPGDILEEKWIRIQIALKYLTSARSKEGNIQKQVAVGQIRKAQSDMQATIEALSYQNNDANMQRLIRAYTTLLNSSESMLAAPASSSEQTVAVIAKPTVIIKTVPSDGTAVNALQNELKSKDNLIKNLKSQLESKGNQPATESVAMFDYKAKNVQELQKQVKFFDWALKDMARQNDELKKENAALKGHKITANR